MEHMWRAMQGDHLNVPSATASPLHFLRGIRVGRSSRVQQPDPHVIRTCFRDVGKLVLLVNAAKP
jgi:hypothetical protein